MTDLCPSRNIGIITTCFVPIEKIEEEPEDEKHEAKERILCFPKLVGLTLRLVLEAFLWTGQGPRDVGRAVRLITGLLSVRVVKSSPLPFRLVAMARLDLLIVILHSIRSR